MSEAIASIQLCHHYRPQKLKTGYLGINPSLTILVARMRVEGCKNYVCYVVAIKETPVASNTRGLEFKSRHQQCIEHRIFAGKEPHSHFHYL